MEKKLFAGFALVGLLLACAGAGFFSGDLRSHDHSNIEQGGGALLPVTVAISGGLTVGNSGTQLTQIRVYTPTFDPGNIPAQNQIEYSVTVTGLTTSDTVYVNKPTLTANCGIANARVSAADTLTVQFINQSAGVGCDPPSEVYRVVAIRS